jgi:hypothetical protein
MAQPLTWRNVDAPDFRGSMAGFRESNDLLNSALGNLSKGLTDFRKTGIENADRELAARALQIQDPQALKQALASGVLPVQGASAEALTAVGSRVTDLLRQSTVEQALKQSNYTFDRTQQADGATDQAKQLFAEVTNSDGKDATLNAIKAKYGPQYANLSLDQMKQLNEMGRSTYTNTLNNQGKVLTNQGIGLSNQGKSISNAAGSFELANARQDRADMQTGLAQGLEIARQSGNNDDARQLVESVIGKAGPGAAMQMLKVLGATGFNDIYGPVGGAASATGTGGKGGSASPGSSSAASGGEPITSLTDESSRSSRDAGLDLQNRIAQEWGPNPEVELEQNWTQNGTRPNEIRSEMAKTYPGIDEGELDALINDTQKKMGGSYASAAAAVSRGIVGKSGFFYNRGGVGGDWKVDRDAIDASVARARSGDNLSLVASQKTRESLLSSIKKADEQLKNAQTAAASFAARAATNPSLANNEAARARVQAALDKATQARDALTERQRESEENRSLRLNPPVPAPVATSAALPANSPVGSQVVDQAEMTRRMLEYLQNR